MSRVKIGTLGVASVVLFAETWRWGCIIRFLLSWTMTCITFGLVFGHLIVMVPILLIL